MKETSDKWWNEMDEYESLLSVMKDMIRICLDVFLQDELLQQSKQCWSGAKWHWTFSFNLWCCLRCTTEQIKPDQRKSGKTHTSEERRRMNGEKTDGGSLSLSRLKNGKIREIDPRDQQFSTGLASRHRTSRAQTLQTWVF